MIAHLIAGLEAEDALPLNALDWALTYRRIDDRAFTLERHRPLEAIYADDHPDMVVIKPAQVGVSELAISKVCHALDVGAAWWRTGKAGLNVGYLFPTKTALVDFSKERFSGLRVESDYLRSLFAGEYDAVDFKRAGEHSYLYLRGMESEEGLLSFPADVLVFDEYDRMSRKAIALAEKRLRASTVKRQLRISTPTLPGRGIHEAYLHSDQQVWHVHCPTCDSSHALDFWRDVRCDGAEWETWRWWPAERLKDHVTTTTHCPQCKAAIDRCGPGQWMAMHPGITSVRGYQVPWYAFPVVDLNKLCAAAVSTDPSQTAEFYRSDLGLPYEPEGARVTESMLRQLSADLPSGRLPDGATWRKVTMGVDVGARLHYRISASGPDGGRYVLAMGAVRSFAELDALIARYKVRQTVIDAMPELHATRDWALTHKGKVLRAFYPASLDGLLFRKKAAEEDAHGNAIVGTETVQINRTMAMDELYAAIANGAESWPATIHNDPDVLAHLQAPVRVVVTAKDGQPVAAWTHTAPDHLFHASVYDRIALAALPAPVAGGIGQAKAKGW